MIRQCKKCGDCKDTILFVKKKKKDGSEYFLYTCIACNQKYNKQYFNNYYRNNKESLIETSQNWYKENIDKKKQYDKDYAKKFPNKKKQYDKEYRKLNKDKINKRIQEYVKNRRKNDPQYKLRKSISYSIWYYLNLNNSSKGNQSILKFLPYSMQELKSHLESKFESWMNWSNYGSYHVSLWVDNDPTTWTWNIDHIIPQSKLPYISMNDDNFKKCWELENLRPLSTKQNILDGNKR